MTSREQEIMEILTKAIKGNNLIEFRYEEKQRIVEPYLIGELYSIHQNHLEEGKYALRAWFIGGYSSKPVDIKPGDRWRLYEFDKIIDLDILPETKVNVRPFYNPNDEKFKRINYRVMIKNL
jgi:predicted DNA-binding transcriptional regulator YafY